MISGGWQADTGWRRQDSPRPRSSPSHARPRGPGTFQLLLHCVWAQLSSSGRKVSGTAIRASQLNPRVLQSLRKC